MRRRESDREKGPACERDRAGTTQTFITVIEIIAHFAFAKAERKSKKKKESEREREGAE